MALDVSLRQILTMANDLLTQRVSLMYELGKYQVNGNAIDQELSDFEIWIDSF